MNDNLKRALIWLANRAAQGYVYTTWSDEFVGKELRESMDQLYKTLGECIDWPVLTIKEAKELGFVQWDEGANLYLIPIWLYPAIPEDLELCCISGGTYYKKDIGIDTRFGCLIYGLLLED